MMMGSTMAQIQSDLVRWALHQFLRVSSASCDQYVMSMANTL